MDQSQHQNENLIEKDQLFDIQSYSVRKSELNDVDQIQQLMDNSSKEKQGGLDLLYDYPKLLSLFEKSYHSVSILDENDQIIGCAVFNDFPQGSFGQIDFKHENFWDFWLDKAFKFDNGVQITSFNSLWLTFLFINKSHPGLNDSNQLRLMEKVMKTVYETLPNIDFILYMLRGEARQSIEALQLTNSMLQELFREVKTQDKEILKRIRGIHVDSALYFTHRNVVCDQVLIRIAREEDHDDLAEIFNQQSEVLTQQFGEFFIADLIATQNNTRNNTKNMLNSGKALVAEVNGKAVGMMSLSSEIDYKILAQNFDLEIYDNLFKPELMQAIQNKREDLYNQKKYEQDLNQKMKEKRFKEEIMQCKLIGQRMCLQQFLSEKEVDIKMQMENYINNEEQYKTLNNQMVEKMIDSWISGFKFNQPSKLFLEMECDDHDLMCMIQSERLFFLETLQFFGLPKLYMDKEEKEGHWKDWEKKIMEQKKSDALRRPAKKNQTNIRTKKKQAEENIDEFKKPSHFDLTPLLQAFNKFASLTAENRAMFVEQIHTNYKKFIEIFTFENGEMDDNCLSDLNEVGQVLNKNGLEIPPQIVENFSSLLECFGDCKPQTRVVQMLPKQPEAPKDEKKDAKQNAEKALKQLQQANEPPKMIDVTQKIVNNEQFINAIKVLDKYDLMMNQLGHTKSKILKTKVTEIQKKEQLQLEKEAAILKVKREPNPYDSLVANMNSDSLPNIPKEAQNGFVINLFCIDSQYQSRSSEFLREAFLLYKDADYIIMTQPHTITEHPLLQNFIQVPKQRNSSFDHILYIMHKDALSAENLVVRKAEIVDIENIYPYISNLKDQNIIEKDMNEAIRENASKKMAFSVFCGDLIIGMYIVTKNVNLSYYASHYCVQDHIILKEHPRISHTRLLHSILNPLFIKNSRFILKEILRLSNKTTIFYETHERSLLPDIFNEFYLVRSRTFPHFLKKKWDFEHEPEFFQKQGDKTSIQDGERDAFDQEEAPFALSMLAKKYLSTQKIQQNTRIIVVGASDTGISLLESLMTLRDVNFTNLTLLAPGIISQLKQYCFMFLLNIIRLLFYSCIYYNISKYSSLIFLIGGLVTMNVQKPEDQLKAQSTNYTLSEIRNLMLESRITVLDAKMMTLDKKSKTLGLDKNATLHYDILINTVGLIDNELQNRGLVSSGVYLTSNFEGYQKMDFKYGIYSIDDPYLYQHFKENNERESNINLLLRKKKPQNISLYGRNLHTICFINGLINRGVNGDRINLIIPPRSFEKKTKFATNKERLEYETALINDPDPFEDEDVQNIIMEIIEKLGVNIYKDYTIEDIFTDDKNVLNKITVKKLVEEEVPEITNKKQEKLSRLQKQSIMTKEQNLSINSESNNEENQSSNENEALEIPSRFLVTSTIVDIDKEIFNIIHENGLVYNGRLIIKSNFQTTDPVIFACGKICEFSQRYKNLAFGSSLRLDKYNGRELGQKLAHSLLDVLDLGYLIDQPQVNDQELPQLFMPVGISGVLPNNLVYYNVKKNDFFKPQLTIGVPNDRPDIVSNNLKDGKGQYIRFKFDNYGQVDQVTYLGSDHISVQSLVSFVGLSEKYLNQLDIRFAHGLIPNISEFLSENWAMALYHEFFSEFRHVVKSELLEQPEIQTILNEVSQQAKSGKFMSQDQLDQAKTKISQETIKLIKNGTLDFIKENQNHLPMYYVPNKLNLKQK